MLLNMPYGKSDIVTKPNRVAHLGAKIHNASDRGMVLVGALVGTLVVDIFWVGMPLDFLILEPTQSWLPFFLITFLPILVTLFLIAAVALVTYARVTAIKGGYGRQDLSNAQDKYMALPKSRREPLSRLMANLYECEGQAFRTRYEKFNQVHSVIQKELQHEKVIDDVDLDIADVFLEMHGIEPVTGLPALEKSRHKRS